MKVPLLVNDFLDRAETVFRDRVGVIDEPDVDDGLGSLTYGEVARRVRAVQAGVDELGGGACGRCRGGWTGAASMSASASPSSHRTPPGCSSSSMPSHRRGACWCPS